MTYPESVNVSAGDATLAAHYNKLRADAVLLGKSADDAASLGSILERYESRLELELLSTDKVRVPASDTAPVSLLIDGYLCQAAANVDLDAGDIPSGGANAYHIFANRVDDSTTFTLTVNTSSTEAADQRRIGRFYWNGSAIVKDSVRTEFAGLIVDLLYFTDPQICNGRLTLNTGVPVTTTDIATSATIYFAPYLGNRISLYVQDYGWRTYSFSEITLDISGVAIDKNLDIWIYNNDGTLTLAFTEWSNDTDRATALVMQDGVLVKTGSLDYRYLGTVRTVGSGVACDTKLNRFTWNLYNQVLREFLVHDNTDNWTYAGTAWRSMNNDVANRISFVFGQPTFLNLFFSATAKKSAAITGAIGLGLDSVSSEMPDMINASHPSTNELVMTAQVACFVTFGFHYVQLLETSRHGTNSLTVYGLIGSDPSIKTGALGSILA